MKKQLTAFLCATGMMFAAMPIMPVMAEEVKIFGNEIFAEGAFTVYDEVNAAGEIAQVWDNYGIEAQFEKDWDSNNGVKTNVTEYVAGYSGQEVTLSLEATNWAWEGEGVNKVYVFFEMVHEDGTSEKNYIISAPETYDEIVDYTVTLTGTSVLNFNESDEVYLCITQGGGVQQYKQISCVTDIGEVSENDRIILGNEIFSEGVFTVYDEVNAAGEIVQVWENYGIEAKFTKEWDANNGVKADITEYVSGLSNQEIFLSIGVSSWAWNSENGVNQAKAFFSVVNEAGDETLIDICSGPQTVEEIVDDAAVLSGSAVLDFSDADKVYLCITQGGGTQQYRELSLMIKERVIEPPALENILFEDEIFRDGAFEVYDSSNTSAILEIWENDGINAIFGNEWDSNNGVKTDITDYIEGYSDRTFTLSVDATNWAWNGDDGVNKMYAFFEVIREDGTSYQSYIIAGPENAEEIKGDTAELSGSIMLSFEETDKVYLCLTHGCGAQQYKNMKLSVAGAPVGKVLIENVAMGENGAYIEASNMSAKDTEVKVYAVSYEGEKIKNITTDTVTIPAYTESASYGVSGSEGDMIFIWDNSMKPYTDKMELR